jgi:hypothetical protein
MSKIVNLDDYRPQVDDDVPTLEIPEALVREWIAGKGEIDPEVLDIIAAGLFMDMVVDKHTPSPEFARAMLREWLTTVEEPNA